MGCIPPKISRTPYLKVEIPSKFSKTSRCESNKVICYAKIRSKNRFLTVLEQFQSNLIVIVESPLEQENSNIFE